MRGPVIALLLVVTAAANAIAQTTKQNRLAQAPQRGHCDVGVVSSLGTNFLVEQVHFFTGNKRTYVPVESFHLDDLVVDRIRSGLGNRAAVLRIPYREEPFASFNTPNLGQRLGYLFAPFTYVPDVADAIRTVAAGTRCTRYILVTPDPGTENDQGGVGITKSFGPGVHAAIRIWVFDGETFKPSNFIDSSTTHFGRVVDESFWPDPPSSAALNAKLREATRELVAKCLDRVLPRVLPML